MGSPVPKEWSTTSFLTRNPTAPSALIILNTPLVNRALFRKIWNSCEVRYCADGGANRLYERYGSGKRATTTATTGAGAGSDGTGDDDEEEDHYLPDLIKGDLDSLKAHVRAYYSSKVLPSSPLPATITDLPPTIQHIPIIHDPDQDSTDLGKCISTLVALEAAQGKQYQLVILGGLSGRLDQTVHTIHALTLLGKERAHTWAVGRESLACVLMEGQHKLTISLTHFGDTCAILPVGQPAHVITRGLKWDLGPDSYAYPTSVATQVSSSNHLPGEKVFVETDVPVVWTVEVRGEGEEV